MKNMNIFIVISLIFALSIFSSTLVLAEENSTNTCVEKSYMECGTSEGNPASINVKILANCDKESVVNELCNNGCSNGVCNPETIFKEQVKCVFDNSDEMQKCYTSDGRFGCSGTGTCVADVSGIKGAKQTWKSSCDGYAYTIIDGDNEYAQFTCASNPEPVTVTEKVKCIFDNSNEVQSCYAGDGKFVCSGTGTCVADVSGQKGKKLNWLSTCEGEAYTIIDGDNEYAEFNCVQAINETPVLVKEQVKCIFKNALTEQKCYTAEDNPRFNCIGTDTCVVDVNGKKGEKLKWKSTCGGYAYTITDGDNEYAEFDCVQEGNTTIESLTDKGFKYAYWQCYNSEEQKQGSDSSCKSSETWQSYAKEFCQNKCYKDGSKCGVNSFSVTEDCYTDFGNLSSVFIPSIINEENSSISTSITEETLVCKDSCPLDGKCYPFGYRKSGQFCSDTGSFIEQLEGDKTCENNFECSSNVCVSGTCISEGFLQKILNWFKNLFS